MVGFATWTLNSTASFGNGTYNRTDYNTTINATTLTSNDTEQELPNNQGIDYDVNMTGNVLLYHLNNDSDYGENDTRVYDFSGNGNNGTGTNFEGDEVTSSGKLNGAFDFDGTNDYVDTVNVANDLGIDTGNFTFAFWMKANSWTDYMAVMSNNIWVTPANKWSGIQFSRAPANWDGRGNIEGALAMLSSGGSTADQDYAVVTNSALSIGKWYYVVGIRKGGVRYLYLDGVFQESRGVNHDSIGQPEHDNLFIGRNPDTTYPRYFDGLIDEVAIYNRSLSATEVLTRYNRQKGTYIDRGKYTSKIFNADSNSAWNNISWFTEVCYQCELPDAQATETGDYVREANMTGNVLLMHFNNDSVYGENDTHVYDFSGSGNNGTGYNFDGDEVTSSGKLNGAFDFDGDDDYVSVDGLVTQLSTDLKGSVSFWAKIDEDNGAHNVVYSAAKDTGTVQTFFWISYDMGAGDDHVTAVIKRDDVGEWQCSTPVDSLDSYVGKWLHVVLTHDGIEPRIYMNGVLQTLVFDVFVNKARWMNSIFNCVNVANTANMGILELNGADIYPFDGTIDEVAIWNRVLTATEILDHYKRGALELNLTVRSCNDDACSGESFENINDTSPQDLSVANNTYFQYNFDFETEDANYTSRLYNLSVDYTILDTSAPDVTINTPLNTSYNTDSIIFNVTATDGTGVDSCLYTLNGGIINYTMGNLSANEWNATNSSMTQGSHTTTFYCNDTLGNLNNSESVTFNVDSIAPAITIISPTATTYSSSSISFEVSTNENSTCNYSLSSGTTNYSLTANASDTGFTSSQTLSNAQYTCQYYCWDVLNNLNDTENVTFTVSVTTTTTPPGNGGNGGGGEVIKFSINPKLLEKSIILGGISFDEIVIINKESVERTFNIQVETLEDIIFFEETSVKIEPNSRKRFEFKISAPSGSGVYTGKIIIISGHVRKEILVMINVETEKSLFDVTISIPKNMKVMNPGENLKVQIELLELGIQKYKDVTLNYVIKDFDGNIHLTESETIGVADQKTFSKEFYTEDFSSGNYVLGVELIYPDGVAVASSHFRVKEKFEAERDQIIFISLIFLALISVFIVMIIAIKKYKKKLKKIIKS